MRVGYVIAHPELGVYLGSCLGMGFWTGLDLAGQDAAVAFDSPRQAAEHMNSWDQTTAQIRPSEVSFVRVQVDRKADQGPGQPVYATMQSCIAAGLPRLEPTGDNSMTTLNVTDTAVDAAVETFFDRQASWRRASTRFKGDLRNTMRQCLEVALPHLEASKPRAKRKKPEDALT